MEAGGEVTRGVVVVFGSQRKLGFFGGSHVHNKDQAYTFWKRWIMCSNSVH